MTNKINGIDVSECSNFKAGICSKRICELSVNENCLFKRFKRLYEENEELKKQLEFSRTHKTVLDAERIKYKQALEEIREITEQDRNCMNSELACCRLCEKLDLIKEKIDEVFGNE